MTTSPRQDAEARGDLAQSMVPEAARLIVAVRDEDHEEIAARLNALDRTHLDALVVVLAAMVDPEQPLHETLAWVDFDEHGVPARPYTPRRRWTIREKTALRPAAAKPVRVDWTAVDRALAGHPTVLTRTERTAAVDVGIRSGMGIGQVATTLGMSESAVSQQWKRIKARARAAGVYVPDEPVGEFIPHKRPRTPAA